MNGKGSEKQEHTTMETCLASKDVKSFDLPKKKLMLRLDTFGIKTNEEVIVNTRRNYMDGHISQL
ncbi:unnamed protein product [Brassica oleracea]|uniref:Uncharacterized protein n=1 Tax=Brassica oleracea var. oleracea TaxID=109376 RepID=A0A0D3CHR1_BRAOL